MSKSVADRPENINFLIRQFFEPRHRAYNSGEFYRKIKADGQPIDHISDHGISLGIYLRDPDGNGVEVFYEMPRAEWPVDYNVFTRKKTGSGRFPGPWDAEIGRDGSPARRQAAAE